MGSWVNLRVNFIRMFCYSATLQKVLGRQIFESGKDAWLQTMKIIQRELDFKCFRHLAIPPSNLPKPQYFLFQMGFTDAAYSENYLKDKIKESVKFKTAYTFFKFIHTPTVLIHTSSLLKTSPPPPPNKVGCKDNSQE